MILALSRAKNHHRKLIHIPIGGEKLVPKLKTNRGAAKRFKKTGTGRSRPKGHLPGIF